jgi:pyruvate carboxylase
VRAYVDVDAIVALAKRSGAEAVYPGYGFLAENPALAEAFDRDGLAFVGPPARVLHLAGNKAKAVAAARAADVPTLPSAAPSADVDTVVAAVETVWLPVFVKAVAGGGGRGMRRVDRPEELRAAVEAALLRALPGVDRGRDVDTSSGSRRP